MQDRPTPTELARQRRAQSIAGLRAMADFLEARPDIPGPYMVRVQHSVTDEYDPPTFQIVRKTDAEKIAEVRRIAALLGVQARIYDDGTGISFEYDIAGLATYVVHAALTPAGGDRS